MSGKEQIIQAAFELFAEKNFDAVGIREIGERASLTNPALYQHFSGKQALGEEVYRRCYQTLMDAIDARLKDGMTPLQKLDVYVDAAVSLHKKTPSPLLFLEDQQRHFGLITKQEFKDKAVTARLTRWIDEARGAELISSTAPTPFLVALIIGQVTKWAVMASVSLAPKSNARKWLKHSIHAALQSN